MFARIVRPLAAVATDTKASISARFCCMPEMYLMGYRCFPIKNKQDLAMPMKYPQEALGLHRFTSMMNNYIPIEKRKVLADTRVSLMYPRECLGYRSFSTIKRPIMKRRMYPLAAPGYRCFSAMIEKPIKSHSSFKRIISMAKLKALKESVEKLLLYAKTISIPIFKEARCIVFQALRTIWFFVTGLVWEYLRHLKKGFEDQVSQYHFVTFVAIISTFMVYLIDRFDLSSYLGFLFKDAKECPIDVLAKEVREMEIKLNEQSELFQQDRQTFIKLANEVQMAISELAGLKVRADRFDTCIEELYSELRKLKDEKKEK